MRLLIIFVLLLTLLGEGLLALLFTKTGNEITTPLLNRYLAHKVPQASIKIHTLRLKPGNIGLIATVNDNIQIRAKGDIDLFAQAFDINYTLQTNEIKTPTLTIKEHIRIRGNASGDMHAMKIRGSGAAFKSDIRYALKLLDSTPEDIKLDIRDADIRSLLMVAGLPPYSTGLLSMHADMPIFTPLNPQVDGLISIKDGNADTTLLSKDFNLSLPSKIHYRTHFVIKTQNQKIGFNGTFNSSLANLALKNGHYSLLGGTLESEYQATVPKLQALRPLTQMPLHGTLTIAGHATLKNNLPAITGSTRSLGGDARFSYQADTLTATLIKVSNSKILTMIGQPAYLSGITTASATLSSLKHLAGTFKVQTQGQVNTKAVKKSFDLDLGKKFVLSTGIKGKIKQHKVFATLITKTTMANLKVTPLQYDLKQKTLVAKYLLNLPDMGRLQPITGKRFKGKMRISGDVKQGKTLRVTGHGKEFGGTIDFKLAGEKLKANATGVTVSKLMTMLDYPQMLEAISKADVDYNLASQSGTLHATLDNARLLPSQLTKLLKQFQVIDLTKERYNNSRFDAKISPTKITFTMEAKSQNSYLRIPAGTLIKKSGAIDAKVDLKIKGKDLQATIRGTTDHPKVSFDGSAYLQNLAKDKLKKKFGKKTKKLKKQLKNKLGNKLKGIGKGLF